MRVATAIVASGILAAPLSAQRVESNAMTWDRLEQRFAEAVEAGYSGAALVAREGKVVLHAGFGLANREKNIPNAPDTIFGVGSTPIDFTKASILLLAERGKLTLDDPITRYFDPVPADKRAITIEHLMTGRSGLPDFHDQPGDRDPDHGWIDRDEAVRRIMAQKLLFDPGARREHSHSAWGLLAAIVELASGESYRDFTTRNLFEPAGMKDTRFFGDKLPESRTAIGYGPRSDGEINAPPWWGPTSWLVMGSGGMVSTTGDMYRWLTALRAGKLLSEESLTRYWQPPGSVLDGGDMYGFEIRYTEGPDTLMIICANSNVPDAMRAFRELGSDVAELVLAETRPPFVLGVGLDVGDDDGIRVSQLVPGGAAAEAGLQVGDRLVAIDGQPLTADTLELMRRHLQDGTTIPFEVERNGATLKIPVQPKRR